MLWYQRSLKQEKERGTMGWGKYAEVVEVYMKLVQGLEWDVRVKEFERIWSDVQEVLHILGIFFLVYLVEL